jgi:hypothetical protein
VCGYIGVVLDCDYTSTETNEMAYHALNVDTPMIPMRHAFLIRSAHHPWVMQAAILVAVLFACIVSPPLHAQGVLGPQPTPPSPQQIFQLVHAGPSSEDATFISLTLYEEFLAEWLAFRTDGSSPAEQQFNALFTVNPSGPLKLAPRLSAAARALALEREQTRERYRRLFEDVIVVVGDANHPQRTQLAESLLRSDLLMKYSPLWSPIDPIATIQTDAEFVARIAAQGQLGVLTGAGKAFERALIDRFAAVLLIPSDHFEAKQADPVAGKVKPTRVIEANRACQRTLFKVAQDLSAIDPAFAALVRAETLASMATSKELAEAYQSQATLLSVALHSALPLGMEPKVHRQGEQLAPSTNDGIAPTDAGSVQAVPDAQAEEQRAALLAELIALTQRIAAQVPFVTMEDEVPTAPAYTPAEFTALSVAIASCADGLITLTHRGLLLSNGIASASLSYPIADAWESDSMMATLGKEELDRAAAAAIIAAAVQAGADPVTAERDTLRRLPCGVTPSDLGQLACVDLGALVREHDAASAATADSPADATLLKYEATRTDALRQCAQAVWRLRELTPDERADRVLYSKLERAHADAARALVECGVLYCDNTTAQRTSLTVGNLKRLWVLAALGNVHKVDLIARAELRECEMTEADSMAAQIALDGALDDVVTAVLKESLTRIQSEKIRERGRALHAILRIDQLTAPCTASSAAKRAIETGTERADANWSVTEISLLDEFPLDPSEIEPGVPVGIEPVEREN